MGLYDRDYMRKRPEGSGSGDSLGDRLEAGLQGTWQRRRKTILAIVLCVVILIAAAILVAILGQ